MKGEEQCGWNVLAADEGDFHVDAPFLYIRNSRKNG